MRGKVTVMTNKGDTMSKRNAKDNPWGPVLIFSRGCDLSEAY